MHIPIYCLPHLQLCVEKFHTQIGAKIWLLPLEKFSEQLDVQELTHLIKSLQ